MVAASAAAALVAEVLDAVLASVVFSLRGKATFRDAFTELIPVIVASVPIYSPAVAILGPCLPRRVSVDVAAVLRAGPRSAEVVPPLPGAETVGDRSGQPQ